ncbi:hypothetical protein JIG36_05625 [Actinoplanes sp. LDG1-06]|uniref:Uncharacterized protein n=1 Tax=Paractinoplanes ovalisporus TaxID=2810368 RepID=A0ABS2A6U6_9ACTN|nr:hypothetical protein [Actinoplanes ovalisporus]MBM2615038.1 hypothetical protein [Actinoplanes ovalisporus]
MMTTETLYSLGWRQGSVFGAQLSVGFWGWDHKARSLKEGVAVGDTWIIATQDCNLFRARVNDNAPKVELRQVLKDSPPDKWGIRARKLLVDDEHGHYIVDDKPSAFISPRALAEGVGVERLYSLRPDRVLALKTWLGNRYSRPAVPDNLVPLATAIAQAVGNENRRAIGVNVRDVLMEFSPSDDPRRFTLVAVITDTADAGAVREWLADAVLEIPQELGTPSSIRALRADEVTFAFVESAYAADLSQLSWGDDGSVIGAL